MTTIEAGLLTLLGFARSPYPRELTLIPSLKVSQGLIDPVYVSAEASARCLPVEWNRWNPLEAKWTVEAGVRWSALELSLGHTSEHGIETILPQTESFDYLGLKYRMEFR